MQAPRTERWLHAAVARKLLAIDEHEKQLSFL
jgi:hypothetical protein